MTETKRVKTCVYGLSVDGWVHTSNRDLGGAPMTLVSAMLAAAGTRNCRVVEQMPGGFWRTVVDRAGSLHDARHVASGHQILRCSATASVDWGRYGWNRRRGYQQLLAEFGVQRSLAEIGAGNAAAGAAVIDTADVSGRDVTFAEVKALAAPMGCIS